MLSEHLELNFIGKSQQPSHPPHVYSSTTAVALRLFLIGKRRRICSNNAMIISLEIRAGDPAFSIVRDTLLSTSFQSVREKKEAWRALYYHTGAMSDGLGALWRTYMQCHSQAFLSTCWKSLPHALSLVAEGAHEDGERGCCKGTQSMTPLANGCNALCGEECSHDWDRKDWPKSFTLPGCICCWTSGDDDGKSLCSYTTLLSLFVISLAELFACIWFCRVCWQSCWCLASLSSIISTSSILLGHGYIPSAMLVVGHLVGQPADDVKLLAFASAVDMKRIVFHRAPKPSLERHYQSNPTVISYLHLWT